MFWLAGKAISPDHDRYRRYVELTDKLLDVLPKETITEAARLLAINVAHYQASYGELPLSNAARMLNGSADRLDNDAAKLVADGMETLAGVLALVMDIENDGGGGVH